MNPSTLASQICRVASYIFIFAGVAADPIRAESTFRQTPAREIINVHAPAAADDGPYDLRPADGVDEELFLIRALQQFYDTWPHDFTHRDTMHSWLESAQTRLAQLHATIEVRHFDPQIGRLYEECSQLIDQYEQCLTRLPQIERLDFRELLSDTSKAVATGTDVGTTTKGLVFDAGAEIKTADNVGVTVASTTTLIDSLQKIQQRSNARDNAAAAEMRRVESMFAAQLDQSETEVEDIGKHHPWKSGEAGFDGVKAGDRLADLARRPRDPFLMFQQAQMPANQETAADYLAKARACLRASLYVPRGTVYDLYRLYFLQSSADFAILAGGLELQTLGGSYSQGPLPTAAEIIRICRTYLAQDTEDRSGECHALLARAYAMGGQYPKAVEAASAVSKQMSGDSFFCYRFACILSLTGRTEMAGDWLSAAFAAGYSNLTMVRHDPDLAALRRAAPARFQAMTTLRYDWSVQFGLIADNIILVNLSSFPMTHVKFRAAVATKGPAGLINVRSCNRELERLAPGSSHTFENVFSVPKNFYDYRDADLIADQTP